jgi:hypothetical protein
MSSLQINITPEDAQFAAEYKAREIEAEKRARGDGVSVNRLVGKYSASTADGSVTEHKVYQSSANDFKTDGIVGSIGLGRVHDGAVVEVNGMTMTLGMAVSLGLVSKDAHGNYEDSAQVKKMTRQSAPKRSAHQIMTDSIMKKNPLTI